jgi:hypothetical protein
MDEGLWRPEGDLWSPAPAQHWQMEAQALEGRRRMEQMLAEEGVMRQTQKEKAVCGGSRMHGLLQQEFEQQHGLDVNEGSDDDDDDVKMLTELLLNDSCPDATGITEKCETFQSWSPPACVQVSANPQHHADDEHTELGLFLANMRRSFSHIDLGGASSGVRLEALCMLDKLQVTNIRGPRFLDLQTRFSKALIELSPEDGMLHISAPDEDMCTKGKQESVCCVRVCGRGREGGRGRERESVCVCEKERECVCVFVCVCSVVLT